MSTESLALVLGKVGAFCFDMEINEFTDKVFNGDCLQGLRTLPDNCVDCCVTSPPYYLLRDYGVDGQIGHEDTPEMYVSIMTDVFREVRRVLKPQGTLWLNIGDSYVQKQGQNKSPYKYKDLVGIPWMLAFSLREDGWYLRQDIIWHKPNPVPESIKDRCTKSHEYIFLMSKSQKYYFDYEQIQEPMQTKPTGGVIGGNKYGKNDDPHFRTFSGKVWTPRDESEGGGMRNKRDVWTVKTQPDSISHFATYPEQLITPCILAGCPQGGLVLDPFMGSGTTARVSKKLNRHFVGFELNPEYIELINNKIVVTPSLFD